jgi:hypothetical protein
LCISAHAHPASGIVVDNASNVYFIYTGHDVMKLDPQGRATSIRAITDGHWLALDSDGVFSRAQPTYFERITPDGTKPAVIYAGGGAPLVVGGGDHALYYASGPDEMTPGGLNLVRESTDGRQTHFSPALKEALKHLSDGVTALAMGPDGSIYVGCWTAVLKVQPTDGTVTTLVDHIQVDGCDEDRADQKPDKPLPYLRGLAVDADGAVFAAATSCHCIVKISLDRKVETFLKVERPWSPTGLAWNNGSLYVLEYMNANDRPAHGGWPARVRRVDRNGSAVTLWASSTDPAYSMDTKGSRVFFYDQREKRLYATAEESLPPDAAGGGVRAVVVAPAGLQGSESKPRIAFLETYTNALRDRITSQRARASTEELHPSSDDPFVLKNTLVRRESESDWHDLSTPEAWRIVSEWTTWRDDSGKPFVLVTP